MSALGNWMAKNGNNAKGVLGADKGPGISPTGPADEKENMIAKLLGIDMGGESEGEGLPMADDHSDEDQDKALLQKLGLA